MATTDDPIEPWYVLSLERGISVLRAFSAAAPSLTISDVAEHCDISRAAARRFLLTLKELGYVGCTHERYFLRPQVLDIGYAYLSSVRTAELIQPIIEEVAKLSGESSSLAVLAGTDILYVARAPAPRIVQNQISIGSRLPAHVTSMGRVLLASLPQHETERRLAGIEWNPLTKVTITSAERLQRELGRARSTGYAVVKGELEDDVASIAVPISDALARPVAALNVSTSLRRMNERGAEQKFLRILREGASRVSALVRANPNVGLNLQNT